MVGGTCKVMSRSPVCAQLACPGAQCHSNELCCKSPRLMPQCVSRTPTVGPKFIASKKATLPRRNRGISRRFHPNRLNARNRAVAVRVRIGSAARERHRHIHIAPRAGMDISAGGWLLSNLILVSPSHMVLVDANLPSVSHPSMHERGMPF